MPRHHPAFGSPSVVSSSPGHGGPPPLTSAAASPGGAGVAAGPPPQQPAIGRLYSGSSSSSSNSGGNSGGPDVSRQLTAGGHHAAMYARYVGRSVKTGQNRTDRTTTKYCSTFNVIPLTRSPYAGNSAATTGYSPGPPPPMHRVGPPNEHISTTASHGFPGTIHSYAL